MDPNVLRLAMGAGGPSGPEYQLYAWGYNSSGSLGLGDTTNRSSPVQVGALTNWASVSACSVQGQKGNSLAIKTDGTLWAWGLNNFGQLGLGNITDRSSPVQVGSLTTWAVVSSGGPHSAAIKTDGTLWTWGRNTSGQLGLGDTTNRSSPVQVGALTNWASVSACANGVGNAMTAAIKTDGTLWTWGYGGTGSLGHGNTTSRSSPVQVGALTDWAMVSAGSNRFCTAVKTDGTLWTWGYGNDGQLGLGNQTSYSSPKQVGALTNWSTAAALYGASAAIKTDGTLWTWGANAQGQLGLGNTTNRYSPVQVGSLTTWEKVAGGYRHMLATKKP